MLALGQDKRYGQACFILLGAFMLARLAVSFLPSGPWSPSGLLCASYYIFLPLGSPHTCIADAAFGESARNGNRLDFVAFRREKITLDERGYRNLPGASRAPRMILWGSSFSLGDALNDEDSLGVLLNRQFGPVIYNISGVLDPVLTIDETDRVARLINMKRGWVLLELLNRYPYSYQAPRTRPFDKFRRELLELDAPLKSFGRHIQRPVALIRWSSLLNMRLQNDSLLPNPNRSRFPEEELIDGRHMLFYGPDKEFFEAPMDSGVTATAVMEVRDALAQRGLRLAVLMLPTGYSVYYPLLRRKKGVDGAGLYMDRLAAQIAEADIPVFNSLALLRDAAVRELTRGRLVYWPDDPHWNPLGVETVVRALTPWLRSQTDAFR
jgi:hypothetical protein